jgi:predicted transcriptional regulator
MTTLTIAIETDDSFFADAEAAARGAGSPGDRRYSFDSLSTLFRTLTPKRWELITTLQSIGPSSLRGLARALERDVKRVHEDVAILLDRRLIARDAGGKLVVPYDSLRLEGEISTRAA